MKLNRLFAIGIIGLAMTACSDDDEFNTAGDVTVGMANTELTISKQFNGTFYNIPIVVDGKANGPIRVTVEVSGVSDNPATEGEDFQITQKTIVIPADKNTGNIEFYPIFKGTETESSQTVFTIVKAEGAQIANSATTVVTLKVPTPYEKFQGAWTASTADWWDGTETIYALNCSGIQEGEPGFGSTVYFSGWMGYTWVIFTGIYEYDETTGGGTLSFEIGQTIAEEVNFGSSGIRDVGLASVSDGFLVARGTIVGQIDETQTTITFDPDAAFLGSLMNNGSLTTSLWFGFDHLVITR